MNAISPGISLAVRPAELGDAAERARIDAFVAAHPDGSLFHRPQWSRAVEQGCGQRARYLLAEQGGTLLGCLPLTQLRSRLFGHALVSAGFGTGGGILAETDQAGDALAAAAWQFAEETGCASLELRGGALPNGFARREGHYSRFERDLPADGETLLKSIPRRQRAEVRRAFGSDTTTSAGSDKTHCDAHFRVYAESVRNLGTPVFPRRLFEAMLEAFPGEAEVVAIWHAGRPVSTHFTFYYKGTALPYWGGGTREARACRGNDLVFYEVMRRGIERGCTRVDFGRSKVGTGAWQRKRNWGFDEVPLVYGVRTADGVAPREINPLNPKYRLKIAAWQRLPLWAANRLGPVIARGLG